MNAETDEFLALAALRKKLQTFCGQNVDSVLKFRSNDAPSFNMGLVEKPDPSKRGVRHLTSSATCFESLLNCPGDFDAVDNKRTEVKELAKQFAEAALQKTEWKSDDSGHVYSRCRTLPQVIRALGTFTNEQLSVIKNHIAYIFEQVSGERDEFGIGERENGKPDDGAYPPNAYHGYWALETLQTARERRIDTGVPFKVESGVRIWARMKLGTEVALHSADSPLLDSDQLAWALTIYISFEDSLKADLAAQDLVRQALKCLFATQTQLGIWIHYRPLFHYKRSGNAYCYNFETFAYLLKAILKRQNDASFYLDALRPYLKNLTRLFDYAERSRLEVNQDYGWNSGHRSNSTTPESWATASVYLYAQGLRRCVGIWARESALADFQKFAVPGPKEALKDIMGRGDSWRSKDQPSVTEQLQTLFVNPLRGNPSDDAGEPDACPISKDQARSAILFGPPGTSKTTLARAVAGQLGWQYVELHSSHFVSEGLASVQRVADRIFSRLMQLDHAVVLFDEVDELVHTRDGDSDQFGRFLTTSMLPRLAELWKVRRVIYFVNTNYIHYFDSAITRSQRFDALILVSPSSFKVKIDKIADIITEKLQKRPEIAITQEDVDQCFSKACEQGREHEASVKNNSNLSTAEYLKEEYGLAKFKILRFDQLAELAQALLRETETTGKITRDSLTIALNELNDAELKKLTRYSDFAKAEEYARRDFERIPTFEIDANASDQSLLPGLKKENDRYWLKEHFQEIQRKYLVERVDHSGCLLLRPRDPQKTY